MTASSMTEEQKQQKEHRVAEKIRRSMAFVAEKANDIRRCSDYMIADEAADMLEYVKGEIEDVISLVERAKASGLFRDEYSDDDCESLEAMEASDDDDYDDDYETHRA